MGRGVMQLTETALYDSYGLGATARERLARLGDLILSAGFNVTGLREAADVERQHFLDGLSLLTLSEVRNARDIVDIGSGAGLPALVLAIALEVRVTALESQRKKCGFIAEAAQALSLPYVQVVCMRAEEYGRGQGRAAHDLAVSRALAPLGVVAEYSVPLLTEGGVMVAMKGHISDQEWIQGQKALGILGAGPAERVRLTPFPEAERRWACVCRKTRETPPGYPRRPGTPAKRPLGGRVGSSDGE